MYTAGLGWVQNGYTGGDVDSAGLGGYRMGTQEGMFTEVWGGCRMGTQGM